MPFTSSPPLHSGQLKSQSQLPFTKCNSQSSSSNTSLCPNHRHFNFYGQKLKFWMPSPTTASKKGNAEQGGGASKMSGPEGKKEASSSPSSPSTNLSRSSTSQLQMRPRFAPELDGVNCFETILPY